MRSKSCILIIIIFISLIFAGCNNDSKEVTKLKKEAKTKNEKIQQLQNNVQALEAEKKDMEDKQTASSTEMSKKGEDLIKNLKNMDSLSKIVDAYYYKLDGAPAEGYSETLYNLYQKEGLDKLIELLNNKDESTIEGVTQSLINEYSNPTNIKLLDDMIEKLNSINSSKLSDKKKHITLRLLEQCYLAKSNTKSN